MEIVGIWLLCAVLSGFIGSQKGEGCGAFFVGVLLGPFGIPIALVSTGNKRECPFCKERVHPKAVVCPHCQREISFPK